MNTNFYLNTPVFQSHFLKKQLNRNIFFKMDCYQPSGSFKIRGMETLCRHHIAAGNNRFIASSGGNAGYSLAYVGKKMGAEVKVVVPKTTPSLMVEKIENLGALVEVYGEVWDEAHQYALQLAAENNAVYVSPFDDPLLWAGHASMIDECTQQMKQPDTVILSVGGGGLLCGVLEGMLKNNWKNTQVITTETEGAASFYESYHAKKIITLNKIDTIATSLGAKKVTPKALELASHFELNPFKMTDKEAVNASLQFLEEYNVLVEPACGAALSVPYFHPELIENSESILVIVCGGVNTSVEKYLTYRKH